MSVNEPQIEPRSRAVRFPDRPDFWSSSIVAIDDKAMQMLTVWGALLGCSILALVVALVLGYSSDSGKPRVNATSSLQIETSSPNPAQFC